MERTLTTCDRHGVEVVRNGKSLVDFSSNDYLGLAGHRALKQASIDATRRWGAGACASRLVSGNHPLYDEVEAKLSAFRGAPCLLMNSGFQANVTVLPALVGRDSTLLLDRACHHSLVQGARLSGATIKRFRDSDHLEALLAESSGDVWVVTEALFSVDGRRGDLARRHGAKLYIDEAHAFGVLPLAADFDIAVGTFGKAGGVFGAYVAGPYRDLLINRCGGLIYTTALPPGVVGAIGASLDLIPTCDSAALLERAEWLRGKLPFSTGASSAQIIPVVAGSNEAALDLQAHLEQRGFLGVALRPPTTAPGEACVRISLSLLHTNEHLDALKEALCSWSCNTAGV